MEGRPCFCSPHIGLNCRKSNHLYELCDSFWLPESFPPDLLLSKLKSRRCNGFSRIFLCPHTLCDKWIFRKESSNLKSLHLETLKLDFPHSFCAKFAHYVCKLSDWSDQWLYARKNRLYRDNSWTSWALGEPDELAQQFHLNVIGPTLEGKPRWHRTFYWKELLDY